MQALTVLMEYGADPNLAHTGDTFLAGQTILVIAARDLKVDLVQVLLEHGADVTQVDPEGKSVLDLLREEIDYDEENEEEYKEMIELCTQYIDSNKPGAMQLLK